MKQNYKLIRVIFTTIDFDRCSLRCQVYLDINIEGKPAGRVTMELFDDVKVGSQRFAELCEEKQGVGYWLSKIDSIHPTSYIKSSGVKSLTYSAAEQSPLPGGDSIADLEVEFENSKRRHDTEGLVSLVVKEPEDERPIKEK